MKKVYEMQILCNVKDAHGNRVNDWRSVRPTHLKTPYQYETAEAAKRMLNICYPDCMCDAKRVVSIDEEGIMEVVT